MSRLLAFPALLLGVTLALAGPSTSPQAASTAPARPKKPKRGPDVLVVTDVFAGDRESILPQPGKPVYYVLLGSNEHPLGASVAGERMPRKEEIERQVVSILAERNFVRAELGGPMPSVALIVAYGPANVIYDETQNMDPDTGESTTSFVFFNQREIANLVGAVKAQNRLLSMNEAAEINAAANEDRLYVLIGALDARKLAQRKKQLVWRTFMSIPSVGNSLPETLAVLLKSGAPHFARDTQAPIFVDDVDRRQTVIEFGELQVLDDDEVAEQSGRSRKRKKPPEPAAPGADPVKAP